MELRQVAEAFSGHRFAAAYPHLADDVRWVLVGGDPIEGRDAVVAACEGTLAELRETTATFERFVVVADGDTAAVDAVGRYTAADGTQSVVSSCDVYEASGGRVVRITSYTVELPTS